MQQLNPDYIGLLATKRQLIEEEHARLDQCLCDLCGVCETCSQYKSLTDCHKCNCSNEKKAACQGRLTSFFYDFQYLVVEHFDNEENIIGDIVRSSDEDHYHRLHQKEHEHLMLDLRHQIHESATLSKQGNVREAIRHFYQLITVRFGEHARNYDNILMNNSRGW